MYCKICNNETSQIFTSLVLGKHQVKYYHCQNCNFIQTETPHWLDEAYSAAICLQDTGIMQRNLILSAKVPLVLFYLFKKNKKFLDYAGGYGIFVRMMRDLGFDFYWEDKFCENLVAKGFNGGFGSSAEKYEVITSFESFEHFTDPMLEITNLLKKSDNILFTTQLIPNSTLPDQNWWYYSFNTGQHISFYSEKTFRFIAQKLGLKFYTNGFLHLLSRSEPNLETQDSCIRWHLLKCQIEKFLNKLIGKKRKFSDNGLFYQILKIRKNYNRKISKILGSKTELDSQNLQKK